MIELIKELHDIGINVLPLKNTNNQFEHPQYSHLFHESYTINEAARIYNSGYNSAIGVLHGSCNPELVCLDFDEKNAPGKDLYTKWSYLVDEYLLKKLVIEKTRSKGYHVYFKCKQRPAVKALANSPAGAEWIACRSSLQNGLTYCAPSPGYTEMQGSLLDIEYLNPQEMISLFEAAMHLNEYAGSKSNTENYLPVAMPPVQYVELVKKFDQDVPSDWVINQLLERGWSTDNVKRKKNVNGEDWYYVKLWRPGKQISEPYSANYWINKKRLSVFSASTEFPCFDSGMSFMHTPSRVAYYLNDKDWNSAIFSIKSVGEEMKIELPSEPTMAISFTGRDRVSWKVYGPGIAQWAESAGFRWLMHYNEGESVKQLVQLIDNKIHMVNEMVLKDAYNREVKRRYAEDQNVFVLLSNFVVNIMGYMDLLPIFDEKLMRDTIDSSYLYFKNGALKITKEGARLIKYSELDGYVFERNIKDFDYEECYHTGNFGRFMNMVSEDEEHLRFMKSVLGYILHYFKRKNLAKAVIIVEDVDDNNIAQGRSGKGLIAQFVEWLRWSVQQDGRNYKSDSQFKMQRVVPGVQIYYLNDPSQSLIFNQFYNYITDDWQVESKGKTSYNIPFENSPKILMTSNYSPELISDSDKDRFIKMIIKKEFGSVNTVNRAFPGVIFFADDWDRNDRNGAIRFAIECLQTYLSEGIINYKNENQEKNDQIRIISSSIPDTISDTTGYILHIAKGVKSTDEFKDIIGKDDLRRGYPDSIINCFIWEYTKVHIYVTLFYQYITKGASIKMNDKQFGKKLRNYLMVNGFKVDSEARNHTHGRRLSIQIEQNVSTMNPVPSSTMSNENGLHGTKNDEKRDGYIPFLINDEDLF